MEREAQTPPLVRYVESTKQFAEKGILESPQFKLAVSLIAKKLGSENPEARENAQNLIKQGIGMITAKVGMLPAFANVENRPKILEQLKKDKVEGAWIQILASWDVNRDKYGIGVLKKCKQLDLEEILAKAKETKDPQAKKQIEIQSEAIAKDEDLIITYFQNQIGKSFKKAA